MLTGSTATLGRLTTPHWEGYTAPSPDFSLRERSQIVLDYVPAGVKVGIEGVVAMLTNKVRLVNSVRTGNVSTPATLLRGVACIYIDNPNSLALCFILYKPLELCKVPTVYPASILLISFNPLPDSFKFFKDNYSTSRNKVNYLLGYLVVNSSPKPFLLLGKFFKMSLRRRKLGIHFLQQSIVLSFSNHPYTMPIIKKFKDFQNLKVTTYSEPMEIFFSNIFFNLWVYVEFISKYITYLLAYLFSSVVSYSKIRVSCFFPRFINTTISVKTSKNNKSPEIMRYFIKRDICNLTLIRNNPTFLKILNQLFTIKSNYECIFRMFNYLSIWIYCLFYKFKHFFIPFLKSYFQSITSTRIYNPSICYGETKTISLLWCFNCFKQKHHIYLLGKFGLQSLAKCVIPFGNSSNVPTVKELINFPVGSGNYCKFSESQIYSDIKVNGFYIWKVFFNGYVEEKLFESFVVFEVGRGNLPVQILLEILRNFYLKLLSPANGGKGDFSSIEPNGIRTLIVANSRIIALWTSAFEPFPFSLNCRLETFGSYHSCRDYKLGRKRGFVSNGVISELVKFNSVPSFGFPTDFAGVVVSKLILLKGFKKYLFLFFGRFKNKFNSPLQFHIHILPQYLQIFKCGLLPALKSRVSDRKGGFYEFSKKRVEEIKEIAGNLNKQVHPDYTLSQLIKRAQRELRDEENRKKMLNLPLEF